MWKLTGELRAFCDGKNKGIKQLIIKSGLQGEIDKLDAQVASIGDGELTDFYHTYFEILYNIGTLEMQPDDIPSFEPAKLVAFCKYKDKLNKALLDRLTDVNYRIEVLNLGG